MLVDRVQVSRKFRTQSKSVPFIGCGVRHLWLAPVQLAVHACLFLIKHVLCNSSRVSTLSTHLAANNDDVGKIILL